MGNRKIFLVSIITFSLGVIMLFGSSYSLINEIISKESYSFNVADFNVQFQDNTKISLTGIPTDDEDGQKNSKEFVFTIKNESNYDVNYRLDIIENSLQEMKSVIKYVYSFNDGNYSDIYLLADNYTLNQNKILKSQEKDTYKLRIWLSIDADEIYMNKVFSASISLQATSNENKYASNVIEYLGQNALDGVIYVDNNYRYNGEDALNYIWFNCQDNYSRGADYCEKWRIIGSFNNTWEDGVSEYTALKIIGPKAMENLSYDHDGLSKSYEDSYINSYANGAYYDLLHKSAKKLIYQSRWFTGNVDKNDFSTALKEEKSNYTFAYVGSINVSDYLYLKENNSWFKLENDSMTMNKFSDSEINAIMNGQLTKVDAQTSLSFMPVVNLKPDVSIISGDGSKDNPYEIDIIYPLSYGVKK